MKSLQGQARPSISFFALAALLLLFSEAKAAFIAVAPGFERFANDSIKKSNVSIEGLSYGVGVGLNFKTPVMLFLSKSELSGEVIHDDSKHEVNFENLSYGIQTSFFISKKIYLNIGYAFHDVSFKLPGTGNFSKAGIKKSYDLVDRETDGPLFGVGLSIYQTRKINFYVEYTQKNISSLGATADGVFLGIRFNNI